MPIDYGLLANEGGSPLIEETVKDETLLLSVPVWLYSVSNKDSEKA